MPQHGCVRSVMVKKNNTLALFRGCRSLFLHWPSISKSTVPTSGLCVLTTDADAPVVPQTSVETNTLHALEIFAQTLIQKIRVLLRCFAVLDVSLTIQHPGWDLELQRVAYDCHNL